MAQNFRDTKPSTYQPRARTGERTNGSSHGERAPREHKPQQNNARYIRSRVFELNERFREVTRGMGSNARGTTLHDAQVDYCHYINEATNGPEYIAPKFLLKAELLISSVEVERADRAERLKRHN